MAYDFLTYYNYNISDVYLIISIFYGFKTFEHFRVVQLSEKG